MQYRDNGQDAEEEPDWEDKADDLIRRMNNLMEKNQQEDHKERNRFKNEILREVKTIERVEEETKELKQALHRITEQLQELKNKF